jgi:hypothetical protein
MNEYAKWFAGIADDCWSKPARRWPLERPLFPMSKDQEAGLAGLMRDKLPKPGSASPLDVEQSFVLLANADAILMSQRQHILELRKHPDSPEWRGTDGDRYKAEASRYRAEAIRYKAEASRYKEGLDAVLNAPPAQAYRAIKRMLRRLTGGGPENDLTSPTASDDKGGS